jgi:hypothetical protein
MMATVRCTDSAVCCVYNALLIDCHRHLMMGQVYAALGLVVHLMLDHEHLMLGLMFDRLIM